MFALQFTSTFDFSQLLLQDQAVALLPASKRRAHTSKTFELSSSRAINPTMAPPSKQMVLNAQFSSWYPNFKDVTIKSEVITLPSDFVEWLRGDGVTLPPGTPSSLFCAGGNADRDSDDDWGSDSDDGKGSAAAKGGKPPKAPSRVFDFSELNDEVSGAIQRLGGAVFPKLNWSAPQDAAWMNMGSLKCLQPGDAYVLLKASDFVSHDIHFPFDGCSDASWEEGAGVGGGGVHIHQAAYTLVLRKFSALRPERSFRCFVRGRRLVGVCQRDCSAHFPQLEPAAAGIRAAIASFFASSGRPSKKQQQQAAAAAAAAEAVEARAQASMEALPEPPSGGGRDAPADAPAAAAAPHAAPARSPARGGGGPLLLRHPDPNAVFDVYVDAALKVRAVLLCWGSVKEWRTRCPRGLLLLLCPPCPLSPRRGHPPPRPT